MNPQTLDAFREEYIVFLRNCLTRGCSDEEYIAAYELGKKALENHFTLDSLLEIHHRSLGEIVQSSPLDAAKSIRLAGTIASEVFSTFQSEVDRLRDQRSALDHLTVRLRHETRMLDKANEALRAATAAAEAAASAKADFLAHMSHEIRTPLNAIIGMSGLLMETKLSGQQLDFADTIRSSGDHLLTIINDILDFSKIEAGKVDLEITNVSIAQCIEDCLDLVSAKAAEKGVDIGYFIEPGTLPSMMSDLSRLRQIILNLLSNAVKFTPRGEVMVTAHGKLLDGNKYELHIAVRDSGPGISPEQRHKLFQPFSQIDSSTTRIHGGTGLGLSISRRLVQLLDGTMWVESEVGKGATFHFTIIGTVDESVALRDPRTRSNPSLQGRKILIVDNTTNRRILGAYMRMWQLTPIEVETPADALRILSEGKEIIDLILVEYELGSMTGLEFAKEVRRLANHRNVPIILCSQSARSVPEKSETIRALLVKPIKPSTLHDCVINTLNKQNVDLTLQPTSAAPSNLAQKNPLRILVAEDNPVNQKVAAAVLQRLGYSPDIVGNGLEAVQAAEAKSYDVILMDMQMPEMDGVQAAEELCRRLQPLVRPRIIALTANVTEEDRRRCMAAGMDTYLSKPVTLAKLADVLGKCLPRTNKDFITDSIRSLPPIATERQRPPILTVEDVFALFWTARAKTQDTTTMALSMHIQEQTLLVRRAIDRGDHASAQTAGRDLRLAVRGGCPIQLLRQIEKIEQGTAAELLRSGISLIASVQVQIEQLQHSLAQSNSALANLTIPTRTITPEQMNRICEDLGSDDLIGPLTNEFVNDLAANLPNLQAAVRNDECAVVSKIAHSIKGSCSVFPVEPLRAAAENLDHTARQARTTQFPELWSTFAIEYAVNVVALLAAASSIPSV